MPLAVTLAEATSFAGLEGMVIVTDGAALVNANTGNVLLDGTDPPVYIGKDLATPTRTLIMGGGGPYSSVTFPAEDSSIVSGSGGTVVAGTYP